jgi:hypothetical protein
MRNSGKSGFIVLGFKLLKSVAMQMAVVVVLLVPSLAQADTKGTGNVSDPQSDFCMALLQSCEAPCESLNNGTSKGLQNQRDCFYRCHRAAEACLAESRANKSGLKMQLPSSPKPSTPGVAPPHITGLKMQADGWKACIAWCDSKYSLEKQQQACHMKCDQYWGH